MPTQSLLEVSNLRGGYDTSTVLHDVHLTVDSGQVIALLGRNGMGKTSTIRAIMGTLPQCTGAIRFAGQDISRLPSHKRARLGIGLVPEARQVFRSLTVREHLEVAARQRRATTTAWTTDRLMDLFPVLRKRARAFGNQLSGGEQQLLVIARALSTNPSLLLLDEPTEGLAPSIVGEIAQLLRNLSHEPGAPAILVVEQNLRFALSVADHAVVLVRGEVAFESTAAELTARRDVQQSLIGGGSGVNTPRSLLDARQALDAGDITAAELLDALLEVMARHEPVVRAMVTQTVSQAREQAAKADARLAAGDRTPMLGVPIVLKDLIDVAGVPTTAGSKVLAQNIPRSSSTVWRRLEEAGAVLLGKANTHEFAYGGTTAPTRNPSDPSRIVGGSSGGPAAALAAGYALGAVGTDTAGSIRIPANLCGVAGLKPTRGLVPRDGVVPLSGTLDTVGPMARHAADLAPLLEVIAGLPAAPESKRPRSVGLLRGSGSMEPSVGGALDVAATVVAQLGADVIDVTMRGFADSVMDAFTIIGYEATAIHRRWSDQRSSYTPYVRERLEQASSVSSQDFARCGESGRLLTAEVDRLLSIVDVLLVPGVPFPASPAYDERVLIAGGWEDRDTALCRNTAFANLTGHPALALPVGLDEGLPVGVQLVGRHGSDLDLIAFAARLEPLLPPGLPPELRG